MRLKPAIRAVDHQGLNAAIPILIVTGQHHFRSDRSRRVPEVLNFKSKINLYIWFGDNPKFVRNGRNMDTNSSPPGYYPKPKASTTANGIKNAERIRRKV